MFRRRDDEQDESGKRQGKRQLEVVRRKELDEGGGMRVGKRQDDGTGGSLKMTCNKKEMTGVEELELRRVIEMRQERTQMRKGRDGERCSQRRRTGECGGLASAVQTETRDGSR